MTASSSATSLSQTNLILGDNLSVITASVSAPSVKIISWLDIVKDSISSIKTDSKSKAPICSVIEADLFEK